MLKLRTDVAYVAPTGKLTQAGVEAIQGQIDETNSGLGARLAAVETELAGSLVNLQTSVAASSQTAIDFTGIPSWVNRVTVMFSGLSTSGTSAVVIQLGDSGGIEVTGYLGSVTSFNAAALTTSTVSASIPVETGSIPVAAALRNGAVSIQRITGNNYAATGSVGQSQTTANTLISVAKSLSDALTQVRITTANGTDTFDAGSVSISWE